MDIISVYNDVYFQINKDGGYLSIDDFNALSKRTELKVLDYISGDITGQVPPIPNLTQKNNDWLSKFITPYRKNVVDGFIDKPKDYYGFEELYRINGTKKDCEGEVYIPNAPIELLSASKFSYRATTFIKELKPSATKPIAKIVGDKFEFLPKDLGSVQLSYIRYPDFGKIVSKIDEQYNDVVPDPLKSKDYEWDEWAREFFVYYICQAFSIHTRENALFSVNQASHQPAK